MKFSSLVLLIVLTSSVAFAQKNFAPLGAEWQYEDFANDCKGNHKKYVVEKEEIINGKDCSVISAANWSDELSEWIVKSELTVWEDSNKVYFLAGNEFYLLFDFNAEAGDTIMAYDALDLELFSYTHYPDTQTIPNLAPYIVNEITDIQIGTESRKLFVTVGDYDFLPDQQCLERFNIIENIGSVSMGFTGQACYFIAEGCHGSMVCYKNDNVSYETGFLKCDSFQLISSNFEINLVELNLFPNPTSGMLNIENLNEFPFSTIKLIDIFGREFQFGASGEAINISALESGIYIFQLIDEKKQLMASQRILKN